MTPAHLKEWRTTLSMTQRAAAARLGYGLTRYRAMENGQAREEMRPTIALACAAILTGLAPYPECLAAPPVSA